jgi:acetyl-CoA carboxylase carboxyltransferase component
MRVIPSKVDVRSADFQANAAHHRQLAADLQSLLDTVREGGPERHRQTQRDRGKMLARERVEGLCDPGTPFLELSPLAAHEVYDSPVASAGVVTGIGRVSGHECMVVCNDASVKGGSYFPLTIKKHIRAQAIALENELPTIYLVDSGGVFLPLQSEVFPDKEDFGRIFYNQAQMSARAIPQIAVVMGMCTAGGAYVPAMSDENVIVDGTGTIYLAGPPLVKAATGESVTPEELGGGKMHSQVSGVTDHLARDDAHALEIARSIMEGVPHRTPHGYDRIAPEEPRYPAEEIGGILPVDVRQPFEVRDVIARLVDGSRFHEFKAEYGTTLVCGFARWHGYLVGIVANNGVLFSESAQKGAHFVNLCNQRGVPLVFLQNVTGFMVGKRYEQGGIARDGAKMVQAVAGATVPRFTVVIGGSHGAGNYAMCGRGYLPRFLFTWPNARISVMGAEQAAQVMVTIKREQLERKGETLSDADAAKIADPVRARYETEGHPTFASARLWDDGIITPGQTRDTIGLALAAASFVPPEPIRAPVFRM